MRRPAIALLLLGSIASNGAAQPLGRPERVPTESLVRDARAKAALGDTASALELLERATDQSPRDVDALYWRSVVLSRTTALSLVDTPRRVLAWYLLHRAAGIDGKNPRYLIELGRIRLNTPIMRVEAERLFRRALTVAEQSGDNAQIAEVAYELGQIKMRRYLTGKNRWLYTSNLLFDANVAPRRPHYTREFLQQLARPIENSASVDRSEAEEFFRRALAALPAHEASVVGLMALLYDQKRYDEMQRVARPASDAVTATARVLLASGLAAYRQGQLALADSLYARALRRLSPEMRGDLLDLGRILRRGDSTRVAGLSAAEAARTDDAFWESADPMLSTPENEARLEFLSRMAFADLFFTDAETHQVGWRTDRGVIIARYGEPPVIATFPPSSDADAGDAIAHVITVWFYPRSEMEFVFFGPPAINSASFAGNFRGIAEERRDASPFMLDNVPFVMAVDSLPVQIGRFRGASDAETELVVATAVNAGRLYRTTDVDRAELELSVRIGPAARLTLAASDTLRFALPARTSVPYLFVDTLRAGDYRLRVEARDAAVVGASGRSQTDALLPAFNSTRLGTSDILIADRIAVPDSPLRSWHGIGLRPRGDLVIAPRDTFSVYWENYGLQATANDRVQFEVRLVVTLLQLDRGTDPLRNLFGNIADAVGLSAEGDQQLGMRFDRNEALAGRDRVPGLVTIGLGTAPAGRYQLEVVVTDRVSGQTTRSARTFTIRRSDP